MEILDKDLLSIQEARSLVIKAKKAQDAFRNFSRERIDKIVEEMALAAEKEAVRLAKLANEETGYGRWEDKVLKNKFASRTLYQYIKDMKTTGIIHVDEANRIMEIAVPVGVIAGLIPSTNPTSTTIFKALIALKAGNAIVFSPHPSARKCIGETARILSEAAVKAGAPDGIIGCVAVLSAEGTNELLKHPDVALILATGGEAMVKAAYSSGTPAIGVGPGNGPAFIERTADIELAVKRIIDSKTFDNGVICASEQSIVVEACIKDQVTDALKRQKAHFLNEDESKRLAGLMLRANGTMNPQIVGKSVEVVARLAGLSVPPGTRLLISEQTTVGEDNPYAREKLAPILAFYSEENWEKACERCIELLTVEGKGHTLIIHSNNEEVIREFALKKPVSRILVNTPGALGGIGGTTNLVPSLTLGCGAVGGGATSDNVGPMHLINIRRLAYGTRELEDLREAGPADDAKEIMPLIEEMFRRYADGKSGDFLRETMAVILQRLM